MLDMSRRCTRSFVTADTHHQDSSPASHSRTIVFEVAPVAALNWHYGEVFVLVCEIRASIDD